MSSNTRNAILGPQTLDQIQTFLEGVWPVYEAAEDWQESHQHACDARCTATNHIPDLISYLAQAIKELQLLRPLAEAVDDPGVVCAPPPQKVRDALAAYKQAGGLRRHRVL